MAATTYTTNFVPSGQGTGGTTVYSPVVAPAVAAGIDANRGIGQPVVAPIAPQTAIQPITSINASNLAPQAVPVVPTLNTTNTAQTTLGASLAASQSTIGVPAGWDAQTYANFKATNPTLEPTTQDTARMQAAGTQTQGQTDRSAILNRILGLDDTLAGKGDFTAAQNEAQGIGVKSQAVQDLTNQYNARNQYYTDEIAKVQAQNPLGKSADAIDQQVQQLTRQKNAELADIGIQQAAASGNLQVATTLAKNAVDAKYSGIQDQVNLLKDYYQLSENDLSESEKLTAQANIQAQQDAVNFAQQKEFAQYQEKIRESSPDYALGLAEKRASIANTYSAIAERNAANTSVSPNSYGGAISTILGSGKFTKAQASQIANSINNGEDPLTVVKNNAKNILGQTEATNVTKYEAAKSAMEGLQSSLAEYYASGGDTGVFTGSYEKTLNKLGQVNNPKLVDLATQIQSQLQVYRNAVSGTAFSDQEGKDIASIFPGINKSQGLNQATISGRLKAFDSTIDGTYQSALGAKTYDTVKIASGGKGDQSNANFVEKSLTGQGINYQHLVSSAPNGKIPVLRNDNGQVGYILPGEYNSTTYTRI